MTAPRAVFNELRNRFEGTEVCSDLLVVQPTEHILRCFAFERRSAKGEHYLWRVVLPLFRRSNHLALNYGLRIGSGGGDVFDLTGQPAAAVADRVEAAIAAGRHLEYLRAVEGPAEFSKTLDLDKYESFDTKKLVDAALSCWLTGDIKRCRELLSSASNIKPIYDYEEELREEVLKLLDDLDRNPSLIDDRIRTWEENLKFKLLRL
jgi:hypothetical protein